MATPFTGFREEEIIEISSFPSCLQFKFLVTEFPILQMPDRDDNFILEEDDNYSKKRRKKKFQISLYTRGSWGMCLSDKDKMKL